MFVQLHSLYLLFVLFFLHDFICISFLLPGPISVHVISPHYVPNVFFFLSFRFHSFILFPVLHFLSSLRRLSFSRRLVLPEFSLKSTSVLPNSPHSFMFPPFSIFSFCSAPTHSDLLYFFESQFFHVII